MRASGKRPCRWRRWRRRALMLAAGGVQAAPAAFSPAGSPPRARRRRRRRPAPVARRQRGGHSDGGAPADAVAPAIAAVARQPEPHGGGHRRAAAAQAAARQRGQCRLGRAGRPGRRRAAGRHAGAHARLDPCRGAPVQHRERPHDGHHQPDRRPRHLNWQTFNVGRDTTVDFRQQAEWAVLNRVNDPAGRPSQIQGQIKAPGTVLIVNRNGVVFDGASQVNVRNLVAAAGRISDEQFRDRGLYGAQARNPASPTRWARSRSGRARASTRTRRAASRRAAATCCCWAARCTTPARSARRAGRRSCRRRQLHHPARRGHQREHPVDHARQRDRAAWRRTRTAAWRNTGLIVAAEGDVTLAGRQVRQEGVALATTTTHARHHPPAELGRRCQGSIVLAPDSVTAVLIDDDGSTALDSQRNALIKESAEQDLLRYRRRRARSTTCRACRTGATSRASRSSAAATSSSRAARWRWPRAGRSRPRRRGAASWRRAPSWTWPARWACGSRWRPTASRSTCRATSCATRQPRRGQAVQRRAVGGPAQPDPGGGGRGRPRGRAQVHGRRPAGGGRLPGQPGPRHRSGPRRAAR